MSRIGRHPIAIPAGVTVEVSEDNIVTVKGKGGELCEKISPRLKVNVDGAVIHVERQSEEKIDKSLHGLSRTLIANMVTGVTEGYSKKLEIV
ncbi:MAG: 50S ribosomal protein L6, partial [Clostridia bacterium]|nr:50S ribosomal protein L6 [Clostridia bacterium]